MNCQKIEKLAGQSGGVLSGVLSEMEVRFAESYREIDCQRRPAADGRRNRKHDGGVAIADIPFRSLGVTTGGSFLQSVANVNRAVFGEPTAWAPAGVLDAVLDGEIKCGAIRASLAT